MDIRNVANHGAVDRSSERAPGAKPKAEQAVLIPTRDEARISATSAATASSVDRLTAQAREHGDREALVLAAIERLRSGALDDATTMRATAERMLAQDFLAY